MQRWHLLLAPPLDAGLVDAIVALFEREGVDLAAVGRAWARAAPTVAIVPAFGLRALPTTARAVTALALAVCVAPALAPSPATETLPWPVALAVEALSGLPVALMAAVPIWIATMTGGTIDALRGAGEAPSLAIVEGRASPLGGLFAMVACLSFFASGGPSRVALALAVADPAAHHGAARVAIALSSGVTIAVAVAAPLVTASIVLELALAFVARAATPTQIQTVVSQVRAIAVLGATALLFDRIAAAVEALGARDFR